MLLADDSEVFLQALRRCFEGQSEIAVVGEAFDFFQSVKMAERLRPDVVLLDLRMRDSHGMDALVASARLTATGATILAMSFSVDDEAKALAQQIGAVRLLDKLSLYAELIPAILELRK